MLHKGAWYTAADNTSNAGHSADTFVLNDFVTITASGEEASEITAYTMLNGVKTEVEVDADNANTNYLFPEDTIEVVAGGTYEINAAQMNTDNNNVDFWYVVLVTGTASNVTLGNNTVAGTPVHFVAGTSNTLLASFTTASVVSDDAEALVSDSVSRNAETGIYTYQVKSSLTVDDIGTSFTIAISGAGIEVRAIQYNTIQYNNISAEQTAYMLGAGWNDGAPTAKAAPAQG